MSSTKVSGYPRDRRIRAPSNGCCSTVGNFSKSKSWRRPTVPQYPMSPPRREAWPIIAASTASACLIRTGEEVNSVRSVQAASRVRVGDAGSVIVRRCSVRSSFNRWTSHASIPIGGKTGRGPLWTGKSRAFGLADRACRTDWACQCAFRWGLSDRPTLLGNVSGLLASRWRKRRGENSYRDRWRVAFACRDE